MLTINKLDKVYVVSMYICWYVYVGSVSFCVCMCVCMCVFVPLLNLPNATYVTLKKVI